jgi:hypothetical protein
MLEDTWGRKAVVSFCEKWKTSWSMHEEPMAVKFSRSNLAWSGPRSRRPFAQGLGKFVANFFLPVFRYKALSISSPGCLCRFSTMEYLGVFVSVPSSRLDFVDKTDTKLEHLDLSLFDRMTMSLMSKDPVLLRT